MSRLILLCANNWWECAHVIQYYSFQTWHNKFNCNISKYKFYVFYTLYTYYNAELNTFVCSISILMQWIGKFVKSWRKKIMKLLLISTFRVRADQIFCMTIITTLCYVMCIADVTHEHFTFWFISLHCSDEAQEQLYIYSNRFKVMNLSIYIESRLYSSLLKTKTNQIIELPLELYLAS